MNECMGSCMAVLTNLTTKGFESMSRYITKQNKFNRKVAIFSLLITACVYVQQTKIEKLSDEVRELKRTRGE